MQNHAFSMFKILRCLRIEQSIRPSNRPPIRNVRFDILHTLNLKVGFSDQSAASALHVKSGWMQLFLFFCFVYGNRQANCSYDDNTMHLQVKKDCVGRNKVTVNNIIWSERNMRLCAFTLSLQPVLPQFKCFAFCYLANNEIHRHCHNI